MIAPSNQGYPPTKQPAMRPGRPCRSRCRRGLTLIEVLVVFAVLGLLVALLIPAVLAVRESSRRTACLNNLRQIGIALSNSEQGSGSYPFGFGDCHSFVILLLPALEQGLVYNSLNISNQLMMSGGASDANLSVANLRLGVLLCPSEHAQGPPWPTLSYAGNCGSSSQGDAQAPDNGFFSLGRAMSPRDISDGLSQTIALSEWVFGRGPIEPAWAVYQIDGTPNQFDLFLNKCRDATPPSNQIMMYKKGLNWLEGTPGESLYEHNLTPNQRSCSNLKSIDFSAFTAGSRHGRGCLSLFADGHVAWMRQEVSSKVWRSLGSRNGAEDTTESDF